MIKNKWLSIYQNNSKMRKNKYNKNMNLIYNNAYKTHNYK